MVTTDRWVIVDDTISSINYIDDSWFADVGSQDATDNGPPFLSTLHGTNSSATLAFNFTGSAVVVMGTNRIRNDSGVIDPQWSCYVDGVAIYSVPPFQYPENNWGLCSSYSLGDAPHTITVDATVAKGQTFWFDSIDYLPSTSVSLANKTIMLTSVDSAIQYGTGWNAYQDIGNWTQTQGALVSLNFYGTALTWYGVIPSELSGNSTTATWVIDDNPAQNFILKGHSANATTAYNQKFFETPTYAFGSHKLTVTYNGDGSKTPLVLGRLVLQNDTTMASATGTRPTSAHTPAIVGGVIGGVVCLLIALFVLYRRRKLSGKRMVADEPVDYFPASQVIPSNPPSRSPAKLSEEHARNSNFHLSPGHTSPLSLVGTHPVRNLTTSGQHSRNPSDSHPSDSTDQVAGPSSLVVHHDGGKPLIPAPPAYSPD